MQSVKITYSRTIKKNIEKHIATANELVNNNNGTLPNYIWLKENGYESLHSAIKRYTDEFSHFKQDRKNVDIEKTINKHINTANELVKNNNGFLPNYFWLRKNNYYGLLGIMWKYPEKFSHFKQDKKYKTIEEWVEIATKLVKKHNGILPNCNWLKDNGYQSLSFVMKKNSDKFTHIKQEIQSGEPLSRDIDDLIIVAEKLTKDNNGILPYQEWLRNNNYIRLHSAMHIYPDKFSHIKQDKKHKTVDEWKVIAEKLVKENNGILPSVTSLKKLGYKTLYAVILKHPEKFAHIPRVKRAS